MATGSTSATDFESNLILFYEKNSEEGRYSQVEPYDCPDLNSLPTSSSLGTGIVLEDTIMLCDGYTSSGVRECYKFIEGQGFQARPPLDIPNGGHSLHLHREESQNEWWLAPNTQGGTQNIIEVYSESELPLPEPLNVVCFLKIPARGLITRDYVFLSGIPTTSSSTGNKNWIKQIGPSPIDDSTWIELPDSIEKRLGGSCGVLHQANIGFDSSDNFTVVVMAGGLHSSTSEFIQIHHILLLSPWFPNMAIGDFIAGAAWQMGPDVGEARYVDNSSLLIVLLFHCSDMD